MHDCVFCAFNRLKRPAYQVLPRLHQHLNCNVVGNMPALDKLPADFILGFGRRGKTDFYLFKPYIAQGFEEFELLREVHRILQRLIAVPQIHAAPYRRLANHAVGPLTVAELYGLKWDVLVGVQHLKTSLQKIKHPPQRDGCAMHRGTTLIRALSHPSCNPRAETFRH